MSHIINQKFEESFHETILEQEDRIKDLRDDIHRRVVALEKVKLALAKEEAALSARVKNLGGKNYESAEERGTDWDAYEADREQYLVDRMNDYHESPYHS